MDTHSVENSSEYSAAGTLFTNGSYILAGFQPNKSVPIISGIGGKSLPGEDCHTTAIREMIEELFDIYPVPADIIEAIKPVKYEYVMTHNAYYNVVYTFNSLTVILDILRMKGLCSPLYDSFPITVIELIMNRKILDEKLSEISHLMLIPTSGKYDSYQVDKYLIEDIQELIRHIHDYSV